MNIAILGAAGGIGSTLTEYLYKKGHKIIGVDNLSNGYRENVNKDYCEFYELDVNNTEELSKIVKTTKCDVIIDLAARSELPSCESDPIGCFDANVRSVVSALEVARQNNISQFIFSSTSAVYEKTKTIPFKESDEINPVLAYSLSKKIAEEIIGSYSKKYKINTSILRLFNTFGPNQDFFRKSLPLIQYITKEIINNRIPVLYCSNPEVTRDYVHVDDVCKTIEWCMENGYSGTLNVCSGKSLNVQTIYDIISKTLNFKEKAIFKEPAKIWSNHNISIDKTLIEEEVNKKSIGCDKKIKELGIQINCNLEELVSKTAKEIYNNCELHKKME